PLSRVGCVQPSSLASYPADVETPLRRGGGGALVEPLTTIDLADDGPGRGKTVRLVPLDVLDNVTDPPAGTTAVLQAGPGLSITPPDRDGHPARRRLLTPTAAGVDVPLDDAGGTRDNGASSALPIVTNGVPAGTLAVRFTGGVGTVTTTTTT